MDSRALKFFEDKNLQTAKIIELGKKRYGLEAHKIKQAMEIVYQDIMDGKIRHSRNLAFAVCRVAKELHSNKYQDDQRIISDTRAVLDEINQEIAMIREEKNAEKKKNEALEEEIESLIVGYEAQIAELKKEHQKDIEGKAFFNRLINFGRRVA